MNVTASEEPWELLHILHPGFTYVDFSQSFHQISVILTSFLFFLTVFCTATVISPYSKVYRKLVSKEKVIWNLSLGRTIFGLSSSLIGLWSVFTTSPLDDIVHGTTNTTHFALCAGLGFFIFECSVQLISNWMHLSFTILINLHHWTSLINLLLVISSNMVHSIAVKALVLEIVLPPFAVCWFLTKHGRRSTWLWMFFHCLLIHLFHCRCIVEGHLFFLIFKNWSYFWSDLPASMSVLIFAQLALLFFVMTPYWTFKNTRALFDYDKTKSLQNENGVHVYKAEMDDRNWIRAMKNGTRGTLKWD